VSKFNYFLPLLLINLHEERIWNRQKNIFLIRNLCAITDDPRGWWACLARCGEGRWLQGELQDWYWFGRQTVLLLQTDRKYQTFRVACGACLQRGDSFRMGSSNLSLATKSCTCASVTFLALIICLATDRSWFLLNHWPICKRYIGCNIVNGILDVIL
jgi:hypothetical protein